MRQQADGRVNLINPSNALLNTAIDFLSGSIYWRVWCGLCSIIASVAVIAFLSTIKTDTAVRFTYTVIYVFMVSSVIWLSVMVRDKQRREILSRHGQGIPEMTNSANTIGDLGMRIVVAWLFILLSIIAIVLAISVFPLTDNERFNAGMVSIVILAIVFQQAKSFHDPSDAELIRNLYNKLSNPV